MKVRVLAAWRSISSYVLFFVSIKNPPILPEAGGCDILSPIPRSCLTWCHALVGGATLAGALFVVLHFLLMEDKKIVCPNCGNPIVLIAVLL